MKKQLLLVAMAAVLMSACCCKKEQKCACCNEKIEIKNVIYMIGDGMGLSQVQAAYTANHKSLNMFQCPYVGLVMTYSANSYITDSAAGGTALATGSKTNNGELGMDADTLNVYSILTWWQQQNKPVGFAVTSPVTHATPAAFYAHVPNRGMNEEIAVQLFNSGIDFFAGSGLDYFIHRADELNYVDSLIAKGYNVVNQLEEKEGPSLLPYALITETDLAQAPTRGDYLPNAVKLAIESLDAKNEGFFLMVEGSQIDWAGHGNDGERMVAEVLDFDKAVGCALDFAKRDGHTLVIITADHETGGLVLMNGDYEAGTVEFNYNKTDHSGQMVPIYAFGPGAENFTGVMENIDIKGKIIEAVSPQCK